MPVSGKTTASVHSRRQLQHLTAQPHASAVHPLVVANFDLDAQLALRDKADQRGQTSAAIRAEELRGQLKRFYVKQVESGDANEFSRMTDDELRAIIAEQDVILAAFEDKPKH